MDDSGSGTKSGSGKTREATGRSGRWRRWVIAVLGAFVMIGLGMVLWAFLLLRASLPTLDGVVAGVGLDDPVHIERDALGVPTITGKTRLDVAYSLGFLHGQERFFQMDLARRRSAGRLAELFGDLAVDADRGMRLHRFGVVAEEILNAADETDRGILAAYSAGVNRGLQKMTRPPFEYVLMGVEPEPWTPRDCLLTVMSMYVLLQDDVGRDEQQAGEVDRLMPRRLAEFLFPPGTPWDAPLDGPAFGVPEFPGLEVSPAATEIRKGAADEENSVTYVPGSNNWAVGGALTPYRAGLLANDMHLPLRVPNTWYRASLVWGSDADHRVTGVTLPGTPAIIVGSNTKVAWGFTNSYGDYCDLVVIEPAPHGPGIYLTPNGAFPFEVFEEKIEVRDGTPVIERVVWSIWGPVIENEVLGDLAVHWVAHEIDGTNLALMDWETATSVEESLDIANVCGIPGQNFVAVDDQGNVGWTIAGRLPRRVGFDGRLPTSWADGARHWSGFLSPDEVPRVVNPSDHRIWTANARVVSDSALGLIGDGGYDLGARAGQIKRRLMEREAFTERDFLAIQLDDEALFMAHWHQLLIDLLTPDRVAGHPDRQILLDTLRRWSGHADTNSVAYRVVRWFRGNWSDAVFAVLTAQWSGQGRDWSPTPQFEGPLWHLTTTQPGELLPAGHDDWDAWMLAVLDDTLGEIQQAVGSLEAATWGERNRLRCRHPMSGALGFLGTFLDMDRVALPGDGKMPRVQSPTFGASERMVVAPGHEENGLFHMPCGQSGHPLSPYYRAGHEDWVNGTPSPFLPGPAIHHLVLEPKSDDPADTDG